MVNLKRPDFIGMLADTLIEPGTPIVYHIGSLMRDRSMGSEFLNVNSTAVAAWEAMEDGKVRLFQRFVGIDSATCASVFQYTAVKLKPPHTPVEWFGCYARKTNSKPTARHTYGDLLGSEIRHHLPA